MKKKLALVLSLVAMMCMVFTSCGGPKTFEEYVNSDSELMEDIQEIQDENEGLTITIKDNTITYEYDVSVLGIDKDTAVAAKSNLEQTITKTTDEYKDLIEDFEEETGIEGLTIVVTYTYKGEVLATSEIKK
ncbi:MAG: DUF4854 domain-containing protein [Firmicutes bacterium]|nr:DUF4854 domain-containing protein [Bacillota bacterium]